MRLDVSFGKGGYKGCRERQFLDTIVCKDREEATKKADILRELGYWTVVSPTKELKDVYL